MIRLALALLGLVLFAGAAHAERTLEVGVGRQLFIPAPAPVERLAVADPDIADVGLGGPAEVRVLGIKAGRTALSVWTTGGRSDYVVRVAPDIAALRQALARQPGLGGLRADTDESGQVRLSGTVPDLATHAQAIDLARAHAGDALLDLTSVAGEQTVAVDVRFAALSMNSLRALGFDLRKFGSVFFAMTGPGSVSDFSFSQTPASSEFSISTGLPISDAFNLFLGSHDSGALGILGVLSRNDLAQVLAEPTLVVRSGETASFLAGGEVPIPVPQGVAGAIGIEYRPFGVRLQIQATVLSEGRILLRAAPEVSELDFGNSVGIQGISIPAFRKRNAETTVELGEGESLVLAGLTFETSGNLDDRIPGLGDLPVIGGLFKRVRHVRERQELVIIATPHIVAPMPRGWRPPLPGEQLHAYAPTVGEMLMGTNSVNDAIVRYGLSE